MSDQHDFSPVRALDENGLPVPGALAYFYIPGTTALRDVFADENETIMHPSPLPANSAGVFPAIWCSQLVKCNVTTPSGASLPGYPMQIAMRSFGATSAAENVTFAPDADITATNVQDAIVQAYTLNADLLDTLGDLAALDQVTTAQFAPAALRLAAEGVASPLDTEVPTVASMTTYVQGVIAPKVLLANSGVEGSSTAATYVDRSIDTVVTNTIPDAFISSGRATIPAGTYRVFGGAGAFRVGNHRTRLQNITAGATILRGANARSDNNTDGRSSTDSVFMGVFTVAVPSTIALQHASDTTASWGNTSFDAPGIFANLYLEKLA